VLRSNLSTATMRRNADQLAKLLRGLVDLAGADGAAGQDEIELAEPASWLDAVAETWSRRAAGRGQLLVPACRAPSGTVAAAWNRLRQIVDLLVDNAVTHGSPGPLRVEVEVEIDARAARTSGQAAAVTCRVVDSGPGLDDDQLARALEPFVRAGDADGLGIGLSRADRLARAAEGRVTLTSDGPGTEAVVTLPATIAAPGG
jgi:two-component system sensor histidine kinase QseC